MQGEFDLKFVKLSLNVSKAVDREKALNEQTKQELEKYSSMYHDILGFLRDNIDLYLQMGEFSFVAVPAKSPEAKGSVWVL